MDGRRIRRTRAAMASVGVAAVAVLLGAYGGSGRTDVALPGAQRAPASLDLAVTAAVPTNECFGPYVIDGVLDRRTFFVGPNSTLEQTYWNGSKWVNQTIPGNPASSTVPASLVGVGTARQQYVFFVGSNGRLQQTYWNGSRWQNQTLPGTPAAGTHLAAASCISPGGFVEDVFFVGSNGRLQETSWNGGAWRNVTLPGAASGSSLTASWYGREMSLGYEANMHVFFVSSSGRLEQTYWNGSAWVNQSLPGNPVTTTGFASDPSTPSGGATSNQHVYFVGSGGVMEQTYWDGSAWRNQILPGGPAAAGSSLTVSGFGGDHVFFVGAQSTGSVLMQTYWNGAVWHAQTLPGGAKAQGLTSSLYIDNLAEDAFGQQVFYTSGTKVEQTYWDGVAWHSQTLPGTAAG